MSCDEVSRISSITPHNDLFDLHHCVRIVFAINGTTVAAKFTFSLAYVYL